MTKLLTKDDCPHKEHHTEMPSGYVAFANRADELSKTHKQIRCPWCGFFSIWVPKEQLANSS